MANSERERSGEKSLSSSPNYRQAGASGMHRGDGEVGGRCISVRGISVVHGAYGRN